MKKIFLIITIAIILTMSLSACTGSDKRNEKSYTTDYMLGIIESTDQVNRSVISLYDNSLKLSGDVHFRLGSMGDSFFPPQVVNGKMYVVPQGIGNQKEKTIVLEMDLRTGKSRELEIGINAAESFFVTDKYLFASSTVNAKTVISRVSLKTEELKKVYVPNLDLVDQMNSVDDRLIAFGTYLQNEKTSSLMISYDMETMQQVGNDDVTTFGRSHLGTICIENNIYFTSCTKITENEVELSDNRLIKYNASTNKFSEFVLDEKEPVTMVESEGKLYILHSDLVTGDSYGVTVFDLSTETFVYRPLQEPRVHQIGVRDGHLYALSDTTLFQYSITENGFELTDSKDVKTKTGENPNYYVSSMFFNSQSAE